jgi:hypothetical protein
MEVPASPFSPLRPLIQIVTIARLTALETLRHPIFLILSLTAVACILVVPIAIAHELGEQGRLARDSALAFQFGFGVLIAGYAASSSLRREIETGILSTLLSKNIGRELFYVGKVVGIGAILGLYLFVAIPAGLLAQRLAPLNYEIDTLALLIAPAAVILALAGAALDNFISRRSFASSAMVHLVVTLSAAVLILAVFSPDGTPVRYGQAIEWRLIPAQLLIAEALLLFGTLCLALAVRLKTAAVLAGAAVCFLLGLATDYLLGSVPLLRGWAPHWQVFWQSEALAAGGHVTGAVIEQVSLYAAFYLAGLIAIGIVLFRHQEME